MEKMKTLSYTKLTQTAEKAIRARLDAAAGEREAGKNYGVVYQTGAANAIFDLWQELSLLHLDSISRASYAADFARLCQMLSPGKSIDA